MPCHLAIFPEAFNGVRGYAPERCSERQNTSLLVCFVIELADPTQGGLFPERSSAPRNKENDEKLLFFSPISLPRGEFRYNDDVRVY